MTRFFKENAYNILGLDGTATEKEALKRSKEILRRLQIDEVPKYDLDLDAFEELRTQESVKNAVQKITSPKKQIIDYFFWFYINDEIDQQSMYLLSVNDINGAINHWTTNSSDDSVQSILRKKNLTILYSVLLFKSNNRKYLENSINLWSGIIHSSKFWDLFTKLYKLNDELCVDQEIISNFHRDCESYLHNLYVELFELYNDENYLSLYNQRFNFKGNVSQNKTISLILDQILKAVEELESMSISADGVFDDNEAQQIKKCISVFESQSEKLNNLSLYENSEVKILKDRAVSALRNIALDIHNNLNELPKAQDLLKIALKFVGTSGMASKIKQDLEVFGDNERFIEIITPIQNLIDGEEFEAALKKLDSCIEDTSQSQSSIAAFTQKKKECITRIAMADFIKVMKLYEKKDYKEAYKEFSKITYQIYNNIEIFEVNKITFDNWLNQITNITNMYHQVDSGLLLGLLNEMKKIINEEFEGTFEQFAMIVLIESSAMKGISKHMSENAFKHGIQSFFTQVIVWVVMAFVFALIRSIF